MSIISSLASIITKGRKIRFKQGLETNLPSDLDIGEPAFTTDEKNVYIGSDSGNVKMLTEADAFSVNDIPLATTAKDGLMPKDDKLKLNGISAGANHTTVIDNLTSTSTTSAASANQVRVLKGLIDNLDTSGGGGSVALSPATSTILGGIKVGNNLSVESDGKLNINEASTSVIGVTKLNDTATSTSTTEASTARVAKVISDKIDILTDETNTKLVNISDSVGDVNNLETNSKTVVGAINELKNEKVDKPKDDSTNAPGSKYLIAGDMQAGYFGRVPANELFTGMQLAQLVGITVGTAQHDNVDWLKFAYQGKILFRPMKAIRHTISWDNINSVGCVFGTKTVANNGLTYKVRLMKGSSVDPAITTYNATNTMKGSEWNKLILPIHEQAGTNAWSYPNYVESDVPNWGIGFTDTDLLTHSSAGNGSLIWCQEVYAPSDTNRVYRGAGGGASYANYYMSSYANASCGWCPVLEVIQGGA